MKYILNIGSGPDYRESTDEITYVNLDKSGKCDTKYDLTVKPWDLFYQAKYSGELKRTHDLDSLEKPIFDEIIAFDIVEHIPDLVSTVDECWKQLKPGGLLHIRTPEADSPWIKIDPTHIRGYMEESFHFFDPTTSYGSYNIHITPYKWKIEKSEVVNYNVCVTMKKIAK